MVSCLKHIFLHPFFLGCIIIYSGVRSLRAEGADMPSWLNGQITDLVCLPFVLTLCLAGLRIIKKDFTLEIKPWLIALICVEYSVIFEWILPERSALYTADWLDVIMYCAGGIIFYFAQPLFRKPAISN